MRIGFFSTFTPEYTLAQSCALARELGYEGIQPRVAPGKAFDESRPPNPWGNNRGTIPEADFLDDPVAALQPVADAGLEVTSLPSYCTVAEMDRAVALLRACGRAGVRRLRMGPMPLPPGVPVMDIDGLVEESRRRYRRLLRTARPAGVQMVIEIHMGSLVQNTAAVRRVVDGFDAEDLGVMYDPGNMVYEGHEPAAVSVGTLGPYLAEVHVKNSRWVCDAARPLGQRWRCEAAPLDDGIADWPGIVRTLRAADFSGWLIEEAHNPDIPTRERLAANIRLLRNWLSG
ncbi:MAG: Inosose dehydratase [Lentisphaerae bacterium ADurb.BinA184]|nr:MAG: Inosose dehydratase [Lentisphaerae bacterium ADurb.BinA184]